MTQNNNWQEESNVWKGAVAGLLGGLAGSFVMSQFQARWSQLTQDGSRNGQSSGQAGQQQSGQQGTSAEDQEEEPATVKAAQAISGGVFEHNLSKDEQEVAGPAVHYTFGTMTGGVYGALAEVAPPITLGVGLPFAAALWLLADEAAVPAFGLSKPSTKYPASMHAYGLTSHLIYGLTTESVRRIIRQAL